MRRVNGTTDAVVGTALAVVNLEGYLVCGVGGMRRVNGDYGRRGWNCIGRGGLESCFVCRVGRP